MDQTPHGPPPAPQAAVVPRLLAVESSATHGRVFAQGDVHYTPPTRAPQRRLMRNACRRTTRRSSGTRVSSILAVADNPGIAGAWRVVSPAPLFGRNDACRVRMAQGMPT